MAKPKKVTKIQKYQASVIDSLVVKIKSTKNNTHVTATNKLGQVLAKATSGMIFSDGSRKSTPEAARRAVRKVFESLEIKKITFAFCNIELKNIGSGRDASAEEVASIAREYDNTSKEKDKTRKPFSVMSLVDYTAVAHGGTRLQKRRKV